jgi:hypothetical protein
VQLSAPCRQPSRAARPTPRSAGAPTPPHSAQYVFARIGTAHLPRTCRAPPGEEVWRGEAVVCLEAKQSDQPEGAAVCKAKMRPVGKGTQRVAQQSTAMDLQGPAERELVYCLAHRQVAIGLILILPTMPHRLQDCAHPCHMSTGTGLTPATPAPGLRSDTRGVGMVADHTVTDQGNEALACVPSPAASYTACRLFILVRSSNALQPPPPHRLPRCCIRYRCCVCCTLCFARCAYMVWPGCARESIPVASSMTRAACRTTHPACSAPRGIAGAGPGRQNRTDLRGPVLVFGKNGESAKNGIVSVVALSVQPAGDEPAGPRARDRAYCFSTVGDTRRRWSTDLRAAAAERHTTDNFAWNMQRPTRNIQRATYNAQHTAHDVPRRTRNVHGKPRQDAHELKMCGRWNGCVSETSWNASLAVTDAPPPTRSSPASIGLAV